MKKMTVYVLGICIFFSYNSIVSMQRIMYWIDNQTNSELQYSLRYHQQNVAAAHVMHVLYEAKLKKGLQKIGHSIPRCFELKQYNMHFKSSTVQTENDYIFMHSNEIYTVEKCLVKNKGDEFLPVYFIKRRNNYSQYDYCIE